MTLIIEQHEYPSGFCAMQSDTSIRSNRYFPIINIHTNVTADIREEQIKLFIFLLHRLLLMNRLFNHCIHNYTKYAYYWLIEILWIKNIWGFVFERRMEVLDSWNCSLECDYQQRADLASDYSLSKLKRSISIHHLDICGNQWLSYTIGNANEFNYMTHLYGERWWCK